MSTVPLSEKREDERVAGAGSSSERWRPLPRKECGPDIIYAGLAVNGGAVGRAAVDRAACYFCCSGKEAMKER